MLHTPNRAKKLMVSLLTILGLSDSSEVLTQLTTTQKTTFLTPTSSSPMVNSTHGEPVA